MGCVHEWITDTTEKDVLCSRCGTRYTTFFGQQNATLRSEVSTLKAEVGRLKGVIEVQHDNWETEYEGRKLVEKGYNARIDKLISERDLARKKLQEAREMWLFLVDMDNYNSLLETGMPDREYKIFRMWIDTDDPSWFGGNTPSPAGEKKKDSDYQTEGKHEAGRQFGIDI